MILLSKLGYAYDMDRVGFHGIAQEMYTGFQSFKCTSENLIQNDGIHV